MEEDDKVRISKKWLQQLSRGVGSPVDVSTSQSLQVIHAQKGIMRCHFVVSERLTDGNGNWHVGAMATLIDNIAGATVHSFAGQIRPTLDFSMSYYSSPKVQEEVEIEAKVVGEKAKLTSVLIEIRKKENGEVIGLGKQWTASNNYAGRGSELWTALNGNNNAGSARSKL